MMAAVVVVALVIMLKNNGLDNANPAELKLMVRRRSHRVFVYSMAIFDYDCYAFRVPDDNCCVIWTFFFHV